jgi:hypothetical protein
MALSDLQRAAAEVGVLIRTDFLRLKTISLALEHIGYPASPASADAPDFMNDLRATTESAVLIWANLRDRDDSFGPRLIINGKQNRMELVVPWNQIVAIIELGEEIRNAIGFVRR